MKFPFNKKQVEQFGTGLLIIAISAFFIYGSYVLLITMSKATLMQEKSFYQAGTNYGMIQCKLKPAECDARYEAWQAEQKLNELLKLEKNND